MNTRELAQIREYVAHVAQVPLRDVEFVHGTSQHTHDTPGFIDIHTGDLADYQDPARARLLAVGIIAHTYGGILSCQTYDVELVWRMAASQGDA